MIEIQKILPFVKPYWKTAALSLVTLIIMVLAELSIPRLIERIIDQGIQQENLSVVISTAVIMVGISLINAAAAILNNIFSIRTGESVARDMRKAIFQKIQQFSYGDLDRYNTGTLMVRLTSDAGAVQRLVQVTLRIGTRAPLMMIGSIILMFLTSSRLAFTILPVLLVSGVVVALFSMRMEPLFRVVQQKLDRLNTVLQENLAGARVVKAFVRAEFESQRFEKANQDYAGHTVSVMRTMAAMSPTLTVFINIGIVLVIWFGGLQVMDGGLQLGQMVAFTNYLLSTMTPLVMMGNLANTWANGMASAKRINEVLDTIPEVNQSMDAAPLLAGEESKVAFQEVDFRYRGNTSQNVLEDITLSAGAGQMVAILGATGAGKSSLVNLIPRFYDVTGGSVQVKGLDVRTLQEDSLLGEVGIVPQETILFSGTIRENICYGKPEASDDELFAAARAAQAHDFILSFPRGYDTHIEERGVNLSGGQKQRIAIARALITNPRILILDDATSSVDVVTETRIQDAIKGTMQGRISFVVAQRISTVLNADKIIVLDEGRIAAEGKHAGLIKTSRIYQEIYDSQLGNGFEISNGGEIK